MCNEKPVIKRRGRGKAKPKLTESQRRMNMRMLEYHFALKDRPPGCRCIYRGDTCGVCRPPKPPLKFKVQKNLWGGWCDFKIADGNNPYYTQTFDTFDEACVQMNHLLNTRPDLNAEEIRVADTSVTEHQDMYDPG